MFNKNTHMVQLPSDVINGSEFFIQQGSWVSGDYFGGGAALPGGRNPFPTAGVGPCPFSPPLRQRAAKTDRHSKIYTSQGPRDRRVRLSIAIARRFFDLQELLGFDKPSKTLEWLLTKSKSAIKELVQSAANAAEKSELGHQSKGKSPDQRATTTKESRAKARARARARTREKKKMVMMSNQIPNSSSDLNPNFPIQYLNSNQIIHEVCRISSAGSNCCSNSSSCPHLHAHIRKSKNPPIWGLHQNLLISRDLGAIANDNWDHLTSFASSQPLYAILDQPKYLINSRSNG